MVHLGPRIGPNAYLGVRHTKEHEFEPVLARRREDGESLAPDELIGHPRETPGVYDLDESPKTSIKGPAKVSSRAYRQGWDTIFGGQVSVGEA